MSMHHDSHTHHYVSGHERASERRTLAVVILTAGMMGIEILCGMLFHSMALLADGWHMATHAGALGLALFAYRFARTHAHAPRYSFGTGKVNALGGFSSAMILAMVAVLVAAESLMRFYRPHAINFNEAIAIAIIGLLVNLFSAWLLRDDPHHHHHHHEHPHEHDHAHEEHHHHHHDHNLKAAYMHVLADALTSVLAIAALFLGKYLGWVWMDPLMGIVGSLVIAHWAIGLMRLTSATLLDQVSDPALAEQIRARMETPHSHVTDLHLWEIAPAKHAAIIALSTSVPQPPDAYKAMLADLHHLVHLSVEVNPLPAPRLHGQQPAFDA